MKRLWKCSLVAVAVWQVCAVWQAAADGCMFTPAQRINEKDQLAAVLFRQGREDLIISPTFASPNPKFAWVVPVPSRPEVSVLDGAAFTELARTGLQGASSVGGAGGGRGGFGGPMGGTVTVIEEKLVGGYDVSVLTATDSRTLMSWLLGHNCYVPDSAARAIQRYIAEGWGFVACKVQASSSGTGEQTGRLAPLRLTFSSRLPVYPMRLSSANPKPFSLLVYIVVPESEWSSGRPFLLRRLGPLGFRRPPQLWGKIERQDARYPTLSRLVGEAASIYVERSPQVNPEACTYDFIWLTRPIGQLGPSAFSRH